MSYTNVHIGATEELRLLKDDDIVTDDIAAATLAGIQSTIVSNPDPNPKITEPGDLEYLRWLLKSRNE